MWYEWTGGGRYASMGCGRSRRGRIRRAYDMVGVGGRGAQDENGM